MIRLLLGLLVVVFFVLCAGAMWLGWRNRLRRQSYLPALPVAPALFEGEPLLPPAGGVYVSTTTADNWQDRIAVSGLGFRSAARLFLYAEGLLVERTGAGPLWIPVAALRGARTGRAMAGKVLGIEGLLVITWQLGEYRLDTGFLGDDKESYGEWIDVIGSLTVNGTAAAGAQGGDER
jgi:hypothetical protein